MKLKDIVIFVVIAIVAFFLYKKVSENPLVQSNDGKNTSPPPAPESPKDGSSSADNSSGSSSGGNSSGSEVPVPKPPTSEDLKNLSPKDNELYDSYDHKFRHMGGMIKHRPFLMGSFRRY
ncbi:hypothetical protein CAPN010_03570 [Capnocytophaga cynodegmi]|uniref:hypothetical protein n=1 Tax=Capnocytophaga cynodegmi TaxID=28189 RepID=UPI001EE2C199|nr:hypothetical protein [Capnocytophaga cynodegmi]GJQ06199.1 hypothetical protein CAPN010_03570 [Capnocytophaga cynodegmi]